MIFTKPQESKNESKKQKMFIHSVTQVSKPKKNNKFGWVNRDQSKMNFNSGHKTFQKRENPFLKSITDKSNTSMNQKTTQGTLLSNKKSNFSKNYFAIDSKPINSNSLNFGFKKQAKNDSNSRKGFGFGFKKDKENTNTFGFKKDAPSIGFSTKPNTVTKDTLFSK